MAKRKIEELESKNRAQIGTFKIALHNLRYPGYGDNIRLENENNIQRLIECLHFDNRLDPDNYIKALIPFHVAKDALTRSGLSEANLTACDPPFLQLKHTEILTCTEGQHRLQAARILYSTRPAKERWWVAILYNEDALPDDVRDQMWFCHKNSESLFDGEIVWNILRCQALGHADTDRWKFMLSSSKRRDLSRLRTLGRFSILWEAFEKLVPFRGLWAVKFFASSRRIFRMISPEELASCLLHTVQVWSDIFDGADDGKYLDPRTVKELQGRSPRGSNIDRKHIKNMFKSGRLFKNIQSSEWRQRLLKRVLNVAGVIPSLETFQENTKFLEPPALALRCLLPKKFRGTLLTTFKQHYRRSGVGAEFKLAYRRLWLFALRHFPSLTGITPLQDHTPPENTDYMPDAWIKLAQLANDEGFNSEQISNYLKSMPISKNTHPGLSSLSSVRGNRRIGRWSKTLNCGTPYWSAFREISPDLTLEKIYNESNLEITDNLSAFSVAKSIFLSFLGSNQALSSTPIDEDLSMRSPSVYSRAILPLSRCESMSTCMEDHVLLDQQTVDTDGDELMANSIQNIDRAPQAMTLRMIASNLRPESQFLTPGYAPSFQAEQYPPSCNTSGSYTDATPHLANSSPICVSNELRTPRLEKAEHDSQLEIRDMRAKEYSYTIYCIRGKEVIRFTGPSRIARVREFLENNDRMWFATIKDNEDLDFINLDQVSTLINIKLVICGYDNQDVLAARNSLEL